jgi:hypothetical protein
MNTRKNPVPAFGLSLRIYVVSMLNVVRLGG